MGTYQPLPEGAARTFARPSLRSLGDLAALLGDPFDPTARLSLATASKRDEADAFPAEELDLLLGAGLGRLFVPVGLGGDLDGYDALVHLARVLGSRDLTVGVSASALVWSTIVWLAGDDRMQQAMAASVLAGRTPCLAYSEEAHGADLLANETIAAAAGAGYVVTGRKWPINRAASGQSVVLLARTGAAGDPRGQSLFWFEKDQVDPDRLRALPRVPTLGVRGADISGLELDDVFLPATARIGPEGAGLEIALKALFVTRTLCAGLSVGAVDAALRTTVRLVSDRRLYGDRVLAIADVRRTLAESSALLLALDAASLAAARLLHVVPGQAATVSAVAKHAIPAVAEDVIARLARIHGARFYLREHHDHGLMQRVFRDHLLVSIFDGSSPVNLHALAAQLPVLARRAHPDEARAASALASATAACDLDAPLPSIDASALEVASRGDDAILNSLPLLVAEIEADLGPDDGTLLLRLARALRDEVAEVARRVDEQVARRRGGRTSETMPALVDLAERYATLHTAAAALHVHWRTTGTSGSLAGITLALTRLVPGGRDLAEPQETAPLVEELVADLTARTGVADALALVRLEGEQ